MRFTSFLTLCLCAIAAPSFAQYELWEWKDHLPYNKAIDVVEGNSVIFTATEDAVFSYDPQDNSIARFSKTSGLSDIAVSTIEYASDYDVLLVGYENGNLDLVYENKTINIADIKRSSQTGSKRINDIEIHESFAYLACGFGVVVIDLVRLEVKSTFIIGPNATTDFIEDIEITGSEIFCASPTRIYKGDINNPFLIDFQTWDVYEIAVTGEITQIEFFDDQLYLVANDTIIQTLYEVDADFMLNAVNGFTETTIRKVQAMNGQLLICKNNTIRIIEAPFQEVANLFSFKEKDMRPNAVIKTQDGTVWTADDREGLLVRHADGEDVQVLPAGPPKASARRLDAFNDNIWVASGGADASWVPTYSKQGIYGLVNNDWQYASVDGEGINELLSINDIMDVAVNPLDNRIVMAASWEEGVIKLVNGKISTIYNSENSSLIATPFAGPPARTGISGVTYDPEGNLWISNTFSEHPLHVMTSDGDFTAYTFSEIGEEDLISDVFVTSNGYIWLILPRRGMLVVNTNLTPNDTGDDSYRFLTTEEGNGALPSEEVFCVEEDLDGEVWIGTLQGPAVFYNPSAIFETEEFDAQQIRIEQDGNVQLLLETETITSIEVDGANRKWMATRNSGVFLQDDDGIFQVNHLTETNSPLFSNSINDLAYNHGTGELYFATINGVLSLMTDASNFASEIEEIQIYPNPVASDYSGQIRMDGFAYDTDIKITDISGNIIFQTISNGGRATWNGRRFDGQAASSGVYLIFAGTTDGSTSQVGKIAITR